MKSNKLIYLIFIVLFSFLGCEQNVEYNKIEWTKKEEKGNYANRDKMIEDLVKNHKLKGLSYKELVHKLGKEDQILKNRITYEIITDWGEKTNEIYFKNLNFYLDKDSLVTKFEISEFRD